MRNPGEGRPPEVLRYEIVCILACPRIVYLSGTPILAHAELERRAFDYMMKASDALPLRSGTSSGTSPRTDAIGRPLRRV